MKRSLPVILILCIMLSLCPAAFADDWKLPEGTPMFEPGCVMETEFGTFTVLDAGFAKKVETYYMVVGSESITVNGISETHDIIKEGYDSAKDGFALFVVKGVFQNRSSDALATKAICPSIHFDSGEPVLLDTYPAVNLVEVGSGTFSPGLVIEVEPGKSIELDFAAVVPNKLYFGNADIMFELFETTLGFRKDELNSYVSIGFGADDGVLTEDVTQLIDETRAAKEKQQEKVTESQHIDEVLVEDISFEKSSSDYYRTRIKVRNHAMPILEGHELVNLVFGYRLLDENGDGIPSNSTQFETASTFRNLAPGQAGWTSNYQTISKTAVDSAKYIEFSTYEFRYGPNSAGEWKQIPGSCSKPAVFEIADYLPKNSNTYSVDNVSVSFSEYLPSSLAGSPEFLAGLKKFDYALNESETYAVIHFSLTNLDKQELVVADLKKDVIVELVFNDGFIYSTDSDSSRPHIFQYGNDFAIINNNTSIGHHFVISPLVTCDFILYLPCAKIVEAQTNMPLVVSVHTAQPGSQKIDVKVR